MIKEACVESLQGAVIAERLGADRIELCADLSIGGTTPSYALVSSVKAVLSIPVMVMIRPRDGNFEYSGTELKLMSQAIEICKKIGVDGVVLGILDKYGNIDLSALSRMVELASPLQVTFHKAIDVSRDILASVEQLTNIPGLSRILTSGGMPTALEGRNTINRMIHTAASSLTIIAAGSITSENLYDVAGKINTDEFHGRKIVGNLTGISHGS